MSGHVSDYDRLSGIIAHLLRRKFGRIKPGARLRDGQADDATLDMLATLAITLAHLVATAAGTELDDCDASTHTLLLDYFLDAYTVEMNAIEAAQMRDGGHA